MAGAEELSRIEAARDKTVKQLVGDWHRRIHLGSFLLKRSSPLADDAQRNGADYRSNSWGRELIGHAPFLLDFYAD